MNENETILAALTDRAPQRALESYVETMLWANTMAGEELETVDARDIDFHAVPQSMRDSARSDILDFLAADDAVVQAELVIYFALYKPETFGHDFALSRCGHGAGFFDRGDGFPALQRWAKIYGPATWYRDSEGNLSAMEG